MQLICITCTDERQQKIEDKISLQDKMSLYPSPCLLNGEGGKCSENDIPKTKRAQNVIGTNTGISLRIVLLPTPLRARHSGRTDRAHSSPVRFANVMAKKRAVLKDQLTQRSLIQRLKRGSHS